jgi:hypothetical protein
MLCRCHVMLGELLSVETKLYYVVYLKTLNRVAEASFAWLILLLC